MAVKEKKVLFINNPSLSYKKIIDTVTPSVALLYDQGAFVTAEEIFENTFEIVDKHALVVVDDWNSGKKRDWMSLLNKLQTNPARDNYYCNIIILTPQHLTKTMLRSKYVKVLNTL